MAKITQGAVAAQPQPVAPAPAQVAMPQPPAPQAPTLQPAAQYPAPPQPAPASPAPAPAPGYPAPGVQPQVVAPVQPMGQAMDSLIAQPQGPGGIFGGNGLGGSLGGGSLLGSLDMSQVEDGNFELLPLNDAAGNPITYEAEVTRVVPGTANSSGGDKLTVTLRTTFPTELAGRLLMDNLTFGPNALWKVKSMCKATGTLGEDGRFTGASEQDWVGNIVRFQIRHDEYEGTKRNKVANGYAEGYQTPGLAPG